MLFKMPGAYSLEIECSDPEREGEPDKVVEGVRFWLKWGDERQPIVYSTRLTAFIAGLAAQWGAHRMQELSFKKQGSEE